MKASQLGSRVWINGALIGADQAFIPLTDRGFTLGDGLFETMFWTGTQIRFFDDHMARFQHAIAALEFVLPFSINEIEAGLMALGADAQGGKAGIRLTLTRGSGLRGLAIPASPIPLLVASIAPASPANTPMILKTVPITRSANSPSSRFKTLSYIDNIMALQQAKMMGADDAIMLGATGNVACASSANVIVHYQGAALTPALEDGALPGIVRGRLIKAGLVEESCITPAHLALCESAVLTNALMGIRAIQQIDGRYLEIRKDWLLTLSEILNSTA